MQSVPRSRLADWRAIVIAAMGVLLFSLCTLRFKGKIS